MKKESIFMLLLGCKPKGRYTEQHDVLFTIGSTLKELIPDINSFWPESGSIHIDCWRTLTEVDGYNIEIMPASSKPTNQLRLFFINLGGYKPDEFEEYHYKTIIVAENKTLAIKKAKETAFFKHTGFKGAETHIDDKYGIDVDDFYAIEDILPLSLKSKYSIHISESNTSKKDDWNIGYTNLSKIK